MYQTQQSRVELVGRDWLQHCIRFALMIAKHAKNIYYILFYFTFDLFQRVRTREINKTNAMLKDTLILH